MTRLLPAVVVLCTLLLAPLAQADYLQWGVDAARSGATSELGPVRPDVAFEVELPGSPLWPGISSNPPLIVDKMAYVLVAFQGDGFGVARVDLMAAHPTTPDPEIIVTFSERPFSIVADKNQLYVVKEHLTQAYPLEGGAPVWSTPWERDTLAIPMGVYSGVYCVHPVLDADVLYVACLEWFGLTPPNLVRFRAFDSATGDVLWEYDEQGPFGFGSLSTPGSLSLVDDLLVWTQLLSEFVVQEGFLALALDVTRQGEVRWTCRPPVEEVMEVYSETDPLRDSDYVQEFRVPPATGTREEVFFVYHDLFVVDAQDEGDCTPMRIPLPPSGISRAEGPAMALSGNDLYTATKNTLTRFDRTEESVVWNRTFPPGESFLRNPVLLAGDQVYIITGSRLDGEEAATTLVSGMIGETPERVRKVYALDPSDGQLIWEHEISFGEPQYAISDGIAVITGSDDTGVLRVLGSTPGSLQVVATVSDMYPGVGQEVQVDLTGTLPGVHGNASEFRVVWGDGSGSPWQENPVFVHSYRAEGDRFAHLQARNEAGQTATKIVTFHVGGEPPKSLSWFQSAMGDPGFIVGFVGVLLAAGGGLVGFYHHRALRSRLQTELEAADRIHRVSRSNPAACLLALDERKARAQGMIVDGKLSEAQYQLLENHIDRLRRGLRVASVEVEWDFLPQGMARSLRTMMEDGNITRFERDAFLERLDKTKGLTKMQKEKVQKKVESWFQEDAGGSTS